MLEILLVLGQELELRENSQYNLLMMELLHHLLKSQDPAAVARCMDPPKIVSKSSSGGIRTKSNNSSSSILASRLKDEKFSRRGLVGTRHGHFGGTWVTEQQGGKRHYAGAAMSKQQQQQQRFAVPKRKNRKAEPFVGSGKALLAHSSKPAIEDGPTTRRANKSLHNFCQRFVKDCYGPVMKSLKNEFRRDSVRLEESDKVVFFRLVWFFSQWYRLSRKTKTLGQIIFTMDVFTFNLVLNATDSFHQHKKQARLAQAVALYSEMMLLLSDMQSSTDSTENDIALGLMSRLFYVSEPMDRLPKLMGRWTPGTNTREYLCDLVELCHVSLKLLEAYAQESIEPQDKKKPKKVNSGNNVEKMKMAAAEFDVKSYFCRKIISNQLVSMYIHLLGQYKLNSVNINRHIIAMFLKISRTELVTPEPQDVDSPINPLGEKRVTLEPMLYNIHLFLVIEQILNDPAIRGDKDFASLIRFCSDHMYRFWSAAEENPMAYVECLFRHSMPHRFCESFTNLYVSEELRMIAEREMLLEEQLNGDGDYDGDRQNQNDDDDDDDEVEFTGEGVKPKERSASDSEDNNESENDDATSSKRSLPTKSSENERLSKKSKASDDTMDSDDNVDFGSNDAASSSKEVSKGSDEVNDSDDDIDFGAQSGQALAAASSKLFDDSDDDDDDVEFGAKDLTSSGVPKPTEEVAIDEGESDDEDHFDGSVDSSPANADGAAELDQEKKTLINTERTSREIDDKTDSENEMEFDDAGPQLTRVTSPAVEEDNSS